MEVVDFIMEKLSFDDQRKLVLDIEGRWKRDIVFNEEYPFNGNCHNFVTVIDNGKRDSKIVVESAGSVVLTEAFKREVLEKWEGDWREIVERLIVSDDNTLYLDINEVFERVLVERMCGESVRVTVRQKV